MATSFSKLKKAVGKSGFSNTRITKEDNKEFKDLKVSDYNFDLIKSDLEKEIGFDSFSGDLEALNKTIYDTYNSWQTSETMKNTKDSVEKMRGRINSYKEYQKLFGGVDIGDDLQNYYRKAVEGWDKQAEMYGYYKNADAFNAAVKKSQLEKKFEGLSYGDVQARMRKYSPDSDEYKFLANYTQYTDLNDFDKALEGMPSEEKSGYRKDLEEARNVWELGHAFDKHKDIMQNEDFAERSKYVSTKAEGFWDNLSTAYDTGYNDATYEYINNKVEGIRDKILSKQAIYGKDSIAPKESMQDKGYDELKPEEVAVYNYWYNYDKEHGTKKAEEFLDSMAITLSKRIYDKSTKSWEKIADSGTVSATIASALTVPANIYGSIYGTADTLVSKLKGEKYNPYSYYKTLSNFATDTRGYVSENIAEATEGMEMFGQNVPSFLYQTGMSILDSKTGGAFLGKAHTALMGMNAYQQKAKELTEKGMDASIVQGNALVAGALEAAFEYAGFEHLMGLKNSDDLYKVFTNALKKQGVTELLEESGTSLGNMIADYGFLGEDSQYMKMYKDLLARGYSEKEANTEVALAMASELGWSAAGGFLSGMTLGGTNTYSDYRNLSYAGQAIRGNDRVGDMLTMAEGMQGLTPKESAAYEAYTRYANKGINGDNITNAQLGNLYTTTRADAEAVRDNKKSTPEQIETAKKTLADLDAYTDYKGIEMLSKKKTKEVFGEEEVELLIESGLESEQGTESFKLATELQAKIKQGKKPSVKELRSLYEANKRIISTEEKTEIESRLTELDNSSDNINDKDNALKIAAAIEKKMNGKTLTEEESALLKDSNHGYRVYAEKLGASEEVADIVEGMDKTEASLLFEQHDGISDFNEYTNSFKLVTEMAKNKYSYNALLKAKGSLTANQLNAIYSATVIEEYKKKQRDIDKLNEEMSGKMAYKGVIDDSVIDYDNKSTEGKVNWNYLKPRQREAVNFVIGFAKATGMNLKLITDGKVRNINGSYNRSTNTLEIDVFAGIDKAKQMFDDTIIPTMSHETTHWMKEKAPELYRKIDELVFNTLEAHDGISEVDRVANEVERHKKKGKKISEENARDEIIARACEDMLKMSEQGRKMFESLSESEQKTFIDKIKETIKNLMEWVDNLLNSYDSDRNEAKIMRQYKESLEELSKLWDAALVSAVTTNSSMELAGVFDNLTNDVSEDGTTIVGDGKLQMSDRTYREGGRAFLIDWLDGQEGLTDEDKTNIVEQTDRIAELMRAIDEGNELPDYSKWANMEVVKDENGEKVLSVIVKNGDYAMNIDFSQVCKKRVALNAVLNEMVKSGDLNVYTLTETDVADLNAIIKGHDFEIACALCFVDSKRYRVGKWAESFCEGTEKKKNGKMVHQYGYNEMVRSLVPKGSNLQIDEFNYTDRYIAEQPTENLISEADDSKLDFSLIDEILEREYKPGGKSTDLYAYAKAIKDNKELRKILNPAEIISSIGLDNIRLQNPELYRLINRHQGTARPKFAHDVVAYGNDILKASYFTAEKAKMVGGVRCQSFSDFMANMVVDYAQFISELSAKSLTAHAYTKEPLFVKLFGLTGMKINMSLVPKAIEMTPEQQEKFAILKNPKANKRSPEYKKAKAEYEKHKANAGLDANGNYIWEDETFPYDIAMELVADSRYSANCGTIAVGISDNHIFKLLSDDNISMVIPYHKSGLNHTVALMRDIALYNDYTKVQNTRFSNGAKLEGVPDFDFYGDLYGKDGKEGTHDVKKTTQNYLKWCDEHNYIPKFAKNINDRGFRDHPNYYKLLIDFRVYDTDGTYREQQPVKAIYPSNEEFKDLILNGVRDKYGKVYGGLLQQQRVSDKLSAETQQIVDEYRQKLKDKYGKDVLVQNSDRNSDYMEAVNSGDMETASRLIKEAAEKAFSNSKVRGSDGKLRLVYHGTVNDFTVFNRDFSQIESDFGKGYYFTSNEYDVDENYANEEGPDLKNKIARYAEKLEWDDEYADLSYEEKKEIARQKFITSEPQTITAYLNIENPVYITPDENGTYLDFTEEYDEEYDEFGEPEGLLVDFIEALQNNAQEYAYRDVDFSFLYEYAETGGVYASDAVKLIKERIVDELTDENGDLAISEVIRLAFEEIGFDGIIDTSVYYKFRNMNGMDSGTTHYIVFDSNQIKSADTITYDDNGNIIPLSERFNAENEDIRYSDRDDDYSYEALINKPDIRVSKLSQITSEELNKYKNDKDLFAKDMRAIAAKQNNEKNTNTSTYLHCNDLGEDVLVTRDSFKHGASRIDSAYISVCKSVSDVLSTSIVVNELSPRDYTDGAFVLLGLAENENDYVVIRSIVNKKTWKLEKYNELYAIRKKSIKKEDVGFKAPALHSKNGYGTSSIISISDFLNFVNSQKMANSVLSLDVIEHLNTERAYDENVTPYLLYSDRDEDISVYEKMGEMDRILKENEAFKVEIERLKERLKLERQVTNGNYFNENQLGAVAGHLRNISNSTYDKVTLMGRLKDVYSYIAHSKELAWDDLFEKCYDIAEAMIAEAKPTTQVNYEYKNLLQRIRKTRISLSDSQKQEARYRFDKNWNRAFFGKVIIANDGISLDTKWQEWARDYPEIFKEDVKEGEQIYELFEIIDSLQEYSEIVEEYDVEDMTRWLAVEIYNQYWNVSPIRTTADKYNKQIHLLNFEHRRMITNVREEYNTKLAKQKLASEMYYGKKMSEIRNDRDNKLAKQHKADKERFQKLYDSIRERKSREVAEAKEYGKQKMAEYKDNAERKTRIQRITKNSLELNDMLIKNSKDKHIPEVLKDPVIELIQAIDFSSKRMLNNEEPTNRDRDLDAALHKVKTIFADASKGVEVGLIDLYGHGMDEEIENLAESIDNIRKSIDGKEFILNRMSLEDLKTLDKIVRTVKQAVNKVNKFHIAQHNAGVASLGELAVSQMDKLGELGFQGDFKKAMEKVSWNNKTPYYAFRMYGDAAMKIFRAFQDGFDKVAFLSNEVIEFTNSLYTEKEAEHWDKTTYDFHIIQQNGKERKFTMSVRQIMALHCLVKQEDARRHLESGGITITEVSEAKVAAVKKNILLTESDIEYIVSKLNEIPKAKQVADKLQEYMNTRGSALGNEVSMARWGIEQFNIKNYFPIKVSKGTVDKKSTNPESGSNPNELLTILGKSFTNARNLNATQSIEIGDILDIFSNHMSEMITYNAMALPVLDAYKWFNYKGKTDFNEEFGVENSMESAFGTDGVNYFTTLLKDINGAKSVARDNIASKFVKNSKIASVGANIRVVLLQPTAFPKASAMIDDKYLVKALGHKPKFKYAEKYCGIALWKSLGYFDINIGRSVKEKIKHTETRKEKWVERSMKGAEVADKITWGYLWNACELEIRDKHPELKPGTDEFFKATSDRLRDVIYATQVVDSTLTRSQQMRSPDNQDKILTMFMSEPTLALNMVSDAAITYQLDKKRMGKEAATKKNGKRIAKVLMAYTVSNAAAALMESVFDWYRDDDDEEKEFIDFIKQYLANFGLNMGIVGKIPYLKDFISQLQGFSSYRTETQWMTSIVNAAKNWTRLFSGDAEGQGSKAVKNTLRAISDLIGMPIYNIYRDLMAGLGKTGLFTEEDLNEMFEDFFN